jgi:hypothetical protein
MITVSIPKNFALLFIGPVGSAELPGISAVYVAPKFAEGEVIFVMFITLQQRAHEMV